MAFTLYFAGDTFKEVDEHLAELGANKLYSHLNQRNVGELFRQWQDEKKFTGKLFADSGAYSAHTKDKRVDVEDYIGYLNEMDSYLEIFAQVDEIPGKFRQPKTKEQLAQAPERSWENYLYMRERVKSPDKLLPIFHMGEDFKHLHRMLDATFEGGKHIPYIGISPANDSTTNFKDKWAEQVFRIIRDSKNPNVKTHAFGMTVVEQLEKHPYYSADSTGAVLTGAMGNIMIPCAHGKFINYHVSSRSGKSAFNGLDVATKQSIQHHLESRGFYIEDVMEFPAERIAFNITVMWEWAKAYKFRGIAKKQKTLF